MGMRGQEWRRQWQPWVTLVPPCTAPARGQRCAGGRAAAGAPGRSCGRAPRRWPPGFAPPARGSAPQGCPPQSRSTPSAGSTSAPWREHKGTQWGQWVLPGTPRSPAGPPSTNLLRREMRSVKSSEYKPAAMPSRHSSAVSLGPGQSKPECPEPGIPQGHRCPPPPHPTCATVPQGRLIGALPEGGGALQGALGLVLEDGRGELLQAAAQQVRGFLSPLVPCKLLPPS